MNEWILSWRDLDPAALDPQAAAIIRIADFFDPSRKAAVFFGLAEKPQKL